MELVLNGYRVGGPSTCIEGPIGDALRDHAERDIVRSVQLWSERKSVLAEVLAALTPDHDDVRTSSIEIITLRTVDASKFMARLRFPNLTYLRLSMGTEVTDWERVGLHTGAVRATLPLTLLVS